MSTLIDLIPRTQGVGAGCFKLHDGAQLRYLIAPEEHDYYAILTRDDGKGSVQRYAVSRDVFHRVAAQKSVLREGEYLEAFADATALEATEPPKDGETLMKERTKGHDPEDENSLQTEDEANLQNDNVPLVKQIQQLYETNTWAKFLKDKGVDQMVNVVKVPDVTEDNKIKTRLVMATTYMGVGDSLIPEITIFDDDKLYICSREHVKVETVKKFMFNNVQKSTKIAAGIGLSMPGGAAIIAPKPGDPAYKKGKRPPAGVDMSGPKLEFNLGMTKTYAELTIKANMRMIIEIGKYAIAVFPRTKS